MLHVFCLRTCNTLGAQSTFVCAIWFCVLLFGFVWNVHECFWWRYAHVTPGIVNMRSVFRRIFCLEKNENLAVHWRLAIDYPFQLVFVLISLFHFHLNSTQGIYYNNETTNDTFQTKFGFLRSPFALLSKDTKLIITYGLYLNKRFIRNVQMCEQKINHTLYDSY